MDECTQDIYDKIQDELLSGVVSKENQLFADYGTHRHKKTEQDTRKICITLTPEEYRQVADNAKGLYMSPTRYVKEMAVNGKIFREDYHFFMEYKDSLRIIEQRIMGILLTIYNTQKYNPADLTSLQGLCDEVGELHRDAMMIFNKRKYGKRTRRKP